jgi:hypothetical protein
MCAVRSHAMEECQQHWKNIPTSVQPQSLLLHGRVRPLCFILQCPLRAPGCCPPFGREFGRTANERRCAYGERAKADLRGRLCLLRLGHFFSLGVLQLLQFRLGRQRKPRLGLQLQLGLGLGLGLQPGRLAFKVDRCTRSKSRVGCPIMILHRARRRCSAGARSGGTGGRRGFGGGSAVQIAGCFVPGEQAACTVVELGSLNQHAVRAQQVGPKLTAVN